MSACSGAETVPQAIMFFIQLHKLNIFLIIGSCMHFNIDELNKMLQNIYEMTTWSTW